MQMVEHPVQYLHADLPRMERGGTAKPAGGEIHGWIE
jgi:hypothetical protein